MGVIIAFSVLLDDPPSLTGGMFTEKGEGSRSEAPAWQRHDIEKCDSGHSESLSEGA
jgi:hypothetical protein